jgi:hypothetical protein
MRRSLGLVLLMPAAAAGIALAGCGGGSGTGTPTAVRYTSAQKLVAALDHGGMPCTGAFYSKSSSTQDVSSAASCSFKGAVQLIDVFSGTVTTKMVLQATASSGTEQIWSDVGPNWLIETSKATAQLAHKAIGGRVVAGPWHQHS